MKKYLKENWLGLILAIALVEIIGAIAGIFSQNAAIDYQNYLQPPLSPPSSLFGIAWVILYALMGIAAYRIFRLPTSQNRKTALTLFAVQLAVNVSWPIVFFTLGLLLPAFMVIVVLIILVVITIKTFFELDKLSAYLLLPYLAWLLFAAYLNLGIFILN